MPLQKDEDYSISALALYVQWVKAYRQLICALYDEHKTVRKAWKAFKEAVPGVEKKLEFGVFEQMLLFSLFMSEWDNSEVREGPGGDLGCAIAGRAASVKEFGNQLDSVIQKLQETTSARDRALWDLKHHEQDLAVLRDQKAHLENQLTSFERSLEMLQNELAGAGERADRATEELDKSRAENAVLQEECAALRDKGASLEEEVAGLRKTLGEFVAGSPQSQQLVMVEKPNVKEGYTQAVIQWAQPGAGAAISPKKVGRWNAQRSKDGYYRLYRKIRGRVHSIYIGKELDIDKAQRRIAAKEKELFNPYSAAGENEGARSKGQIEMKVPARDINVREGN